jgi:hypothetical protein
MVQDTKIMGSICHPIARRVGYYNKLLLLKKLSKSN